MQERKSASRSCTGLMHSRKKMEVGSSIFWHTCAVNTSFGSDQQGYCCCCIYFPAYKLYTLCHVEDCRRHYRLDTNIRRPLYCQQTKKTLGFNASFAILKKGMKSCTYVFKCERRTKVPMEKEPQQTCSIRRQTETVSSSKAVLEHGLLSQVDNLDKNISVL